MAPAVVDGVVLAGAVVVAGVAVLALDAPPPQAANSPAITMRKKTNGSGRRTGAESKAEVGIASHRTTAT